MHVIPRTLKPVFADRTTAEWYDTSPRNYFPSSSTELHSLHNEAGSRSLTLDPTVYSSTPKRPEIQSNGIYMANQTGFNGNAVGLIGSGKRFAIMFSFNLGVSITNYTDAAARDAASVSEGALGRVTADTKTTFTPDVSIVLDGNYPTANIVNGYYIYNLGSWSAADVSTGLPFWVLSGRNGAYLRLYLTKLGQVYAGIYAGSGAPYAVSTRGTNVLATSGVQTIALFRDEQFLRMVLNGREICGVDISQMPAFNVETLYINGASRSNSTSFPYQGWPHYFKGLTFVENPTWPGFIRKYNAHVARTGGTAMDMPVAALGWLSAGQSWWEGSTSVTDTWTTPGSSWNGTVTRENTTYSGEHNIMTREFIPHVYCTRSSMYPTDIAPLSGATNGYGTQVSGDTHLPGDGSTETASSFGLFKHIREHAQTPAADWIISSAGGGGLSLASLSAETPYTLAQIRHLAPGSLTVYEKLLKSVIHACDFAQARGQTYKVEGFLWQQGHSDQVNSSYVTDFLAYYDKLVTAIQSITGQTTSPKCFFPQINYSFNGVQNGCVADNAAIDQKLLDIVDNRGSRPLYCIGPMYQITNFIHAYRAAHRWIGEIAGKVAKRVLFDGTAWDCLRPTTFTRGSNYVDIDFNVPVGNLQFVDDNGNNVEARVTHNGVDTYGFEYYRSKYAGATITIASPGVISWPGHTLSNGNKVAFTTYGALPTGISANTDYYVVNAGSGTFQISATLGGAAINTSGSQSGTHTVYNVTVGISSVSITSASRVRVNLDASTAAGDVVSYTGRHSRYGNLCDEDNETAYYKDQDWTAPFSGGAPSYVEGSLNDLRNWCCAFIKTLS